MQTTTRRITYGAAAALTLVGAMWAVTAATPVRAAGRHADSIPTPEFGKIIGQEIATLTAPPNVPPPITRTHATKVIVKLEAVEKTMRLADSVEYHYWTFGGTVPGSFIRVRAGDLVEFHHGERD